MPRTISTSLIRQLERQEIEATPFAKVSDDVQLVNIQSSSAHLGPMVTNAHSGCSATSLAGGAGTFAGLRLTAPANRTLAVYYLENTNATATALYRVQMPPVGTFTPTGAAPCVEWGDEASLKTIEVGHNNVSLLGSYFTLPVGSAGIVPIYLAPGEVMGVIYTSANQNFTASLGIEEFG